MNADERRIEAAPANSFFGRARALRRRLNPAEQELDERRYETSQSEDLFSSRSAFIGGSIGS
jgi:hypothetical protein